MPTRPLPPPVARPDGSALLRIAVVAADAGALALGWGVVVHLVALPPASREVWLGGLATLAVGLVALHAAGAHQRRLVRVRHRELVATTKAAVAPAGLLVVLLPPTAGTSVPLVLAAAACWALLLAATRAVVGEWIRGRRARGRLQTPIMVVGTGRARDVTDFLAAHPHLGYDVRDTVELLPGRADDRLRALGDLAEEAGVSGLVVTDPGDPVVQPLLPALTRMGLHVHVATGVVGFELRDTVTSSLAGECFLDVAPVPGPSRHEAAIRAADVLLAATGLLLTSPLWLAATGVVWARGRPVLLRQPRIGRHGQPFARLRFRLPHGNGCRTRLLRATAVERLPELCNVLRGDMSIVGPSPAHPHEHAHLDDQLQRRTEVRPGITGLWQVDGQELPSFELCRRLDLLYVDNRSIALYASVVLRALTSLAGRATRAVARRSVGALPRTRPEERPAIRHEVQEQTGNGGRTWGRTTP